MATRKNNTAQVIPSSVTPEVGIDLLGQLIARAEELLANQNLDDVSHENWEIKARDYLTRACGSDSPYIERLLNSAGVITIGEGDEFYEQEIAVTIRKQIRFLKAAIESLNNDIELNPRCLKCGQQNPKDQIYCSYCGKPLRPPEDTPTVSF